MTKGKNNKVTKKIEQIVILISCLAIMVVAAVERDGKVWGHSLNEEPADTAAAAGGAAVDTMRTLADGA